MIPEIILYNIVNGALEQIRSDWNSKNALPTPQPQKTLFYKIFNGVKFGQYNYFEQAKSIILETPDYSRRIETNMFFNSKRAGLPTIHIHLPDESVGKDSINMDSGSFGYNFDNTAGTFSQNKARAFQVRYALIITSDNTMEVLLVYYFLKWLFISILDNLGTIGFRNIMLGGGDIQLPSEVFANQLFSRSLTISFDYEFVSQSVFEESIVEGFLFNGTPYEHN